MDHVDFITTEASNDLIVSFAICGDEPGEVRSVTLLRTPKYESILDSSERGVHVSDEDLENDDGNILESITFLGFQVHIVSRLTDHRLDCIDVDPTEVAAAKTMVRQMNFDNHFLIRTG
jgi:hypothetical protein